MGQKSKMDIPGDKDSARVGSERGQRPILDRGLVEIGDPADGSLRYWVSPSEDAGGLPPAQGRATTELNLIAEKAIAGERHHGCNGQERTISAGERSHKHGGL